MCIVPGCPNKPYALGACRKHHPKIREMVPKTGTPRGARVLATRISDEARARLVRAGKGTVFGSAYLVASRILETITPEEAARFLETEDEPVK